MARRDANAEWNLHGDGDISWERVPIAVLMDIRDELQRLNRFLYCPNCIRIPRVLDRIAANTTKPKKRRSRGGRTR